jgi:uncharacterized protein (DUF2235 family)
VGRAGFPETVNIGATMTQPRQTGLQAPRKRLALFFDGTWNKPENNTNVYRLFLMLAKQSDDAAIQKGFYDQGVGTHWFDRVSGGALGWGVSENVCLGYRWLMEHYDPGDEIFLFGFSRGAFTARSLAGLIAECGLLKPDAAMSFRQLYERYQQGKLAKPIYTLRFEKTKGRNDFDFEERVLLDHSWYERGLIKMVGVWDTVGSLGIPFGNVPGLSRKTLGFHNTHLSSVVEHNYQALALDEQRKPYWGMLWTNFVPNQTDTEEARRADNRFIEQRWFSGAHCDVGGGYRNDLVSQRPLSWLQGKAKRCGLGFRSVIEVDPGDLAGYCHDSYADFLGGMWKYLTLGHRYVRWVQSNPVRKTEGWVHTVNERIDRSVFERCKATSSYRPASLIEWAGRKNLDLDEIILNPDRHAALSAEVERPGVEACEPPPKLQPKRTLE